MKGGARVGLVLLAAACSHAAPDRTPEDTVRAWLDHMEESRGDPTEAAEAYALLGPKARENLVARAARTMEVEGRRTQPSDMLALGHFGLRFRPKAMHAIITGDRAVVDVTGDDPATERAKVTCVRQADGWRIEPELPAVASPVRLEDGGG